MKNVIIVTDINEDPDDLVTLVMASELHKRKIINVLGVITTVGNHNTIKKRAKYASGVFKLLNCDIPVYMGAEYKIDYKTRKLKDHVFMHNEFSENTLKQGGVYYTNVNEFLTNIFKKAKVKSITYLNIAGFTDLNNLIKNNEQLFLKKIKEVYIMSAVQQNTSSDIVLPGRVAHNNCIDMPSTEFVYDFLQKNNVEIYLINSANVKKLPINMDYYNTLKQSGHILAKELYHVQYQIMGHHYESMCKGAAEAKYDIEWYYKNFTSLKTTTKYDFDYVWQFIDRLYLYDPLTLIACVDEYKTNFFEIEPLGKLKVVVPKDKQSIYKLFKELPLAAFKRNQI